MGIQGLSKLLYEKSPNAVKEQELKNYFGRRIAIDASMSIYQFIIAMKGFQDGRGMELTNDAGEVTSHINGLFTRTLRMIDEGIKPIYVFDGVAPKLKLGELEGRRERANEALKEFDKAKEAGDDELMEKMSKRTVRVSREQLDECMRLLRLMGIPVIQAASEAEAQCAELVKKGKAWAVGTEDMDALTFGAPIMLRHVNISEAKKRPIAEFHYDEVLQQTGLTSDQFIDLCILLGCDYVPKIAGIGPQKAWEAIKKYGSIELFLESLDTNKYTVPANFNYAEAREFFRHPDVVPGESVTIQFTEPDADGLMQFLVQEKLFNADRVLKGIERLKNALVRKAQGRLEDFFTISKVKKTVVDAHHSHGTSLKRGRDTAASEVHVAGKLRNGGTGYKKAVKK